MAKNQFNDAIKEADLSLQQIEQRWLSIDKTILKAAKDAAKLGKTDFNSAQPKDLNDRLQKNATYRKQVNAEVEKQRLLEIQLDKAREKAFDKYEAQLKKEQASRERQIKNESNLRQALARQKAAEEKKDAAAAAKARADAEKLALAKRKLTVEYEKELYEARKLKVFRKEEAILTSKLATEYQKTSVRLEKLRREYKDLATRQEVHNNLTKKEVLEMKRLEREANKLDTALKKVDKAVGQSQRNVGNYSSALKPLTAGFRSFLGAFGLTSGIYLFAGAVKDAFNRVREFDKSMQNLSGVFRTTRKELKPLESDIIRIAGASVKTSNEVAKLAESLATLGKTPEQISKLLKPVVDLGIGLNATSEEAGEFLVQMLNTFGASEDEAESYADTIATIRTSTSLDFQKMRDSFQYLAPISRALNKDLAYTGAVIGILADNGIRAERAGRLLGTSQQKLASEGKTLTDALNELNDAKKRNVSELDLLRLASKLFGKQAAALGVVLANNSGIIETNSQKIRENGGALDDLVNEQMKSLDNKLKALDASWEELILTIENGNGSLSRSFNGFIDTLTNAIRLTTELEKAQSKVFEITGQEGTDGFRKFFNGILPGLGLINSEYDDLIDRQKEFNSINENIDVNGIQTLTSMYDKLFKQTTENNDLTYQEIRLNREQLGVIKEAIQRKKDQRKALEEEANALGFSQKELGKYANTIRQYTNEDLQLFISKNKEATEGLNKNTDAGDDNDDGKLKGIQAIQGSIGAMEQVISTLEDEQSKLATSAGEWQAYQVKIDDAKDALERFQDEVSNFDNADVFDINDIDTSNYGPTDEDIEEGLDRDLKFRKNELEQIKEYEDKKKEVLQDTADYQRDLQNQVFEFGRNIISGIVDAENQKYDKLIDQSNSYYESEIERAEGNDERQQQLKEQQQQKEEELQKKKEETQKRAFVLEQAAALAKVTIDTLQKVAAIKAQAAVFLSNPFTAPLAALALAQIPTVLLTGGLAAAGIAATTIPALKDGDLTGKHEGVVKINDARGSKFKEIVQRTSGEMEVYSGRDVLINKKKGDKVYKAGTAPGGYDYNDLMNTSINMSMADQYGRMSQSEARQTFDAELIRQTMQSELQHAVKAIKGIKINNTIQNKQASNYAASKFKRRA